MQINTYYPKDEDKRLYWILDDESLEFSNEYELEALLEADQVEVSAEHAEQLTAVGGVFAPCGEISMRGVGNEQVIKAHEAMNLAEANALDVLVAAEAQCQSPAPPHVTA